jgi:hypothetical protein
MSWAAAVASCAGVLHDPRARRYLVIVLRYVVVVLAITLAIALAWQFPWTPALVIVEHLLGIPPLL